MVAPISVTRPSSTAGSSASCWALLKRWISSRNRIVRVPLVSRRCSARSITARTSARPACDRAQLLEGGPERRRRSGRASSCPTPAVRRAPSSGAALLDRRPQRRALAEQVRLADELVQACAGGRAPPAAGRGFGPRWEGSPSSRGSAPRQPRWVLGAEQGVHMSDVAASRGCPAAETCRKVASRPRRTCRFGVLETDAHWEQHAIRGDLPSRVGSARHGSPARRGSREWPDHRRKRWPQDWLDPRRTGSHSNEDRTGKASRAIFGTASTRGRRPEDSVRNVKKSRHSRRSGSSL